MLVTTPEKKERRNRVMQPGDFGAYSPGITRIEQLVAEKIRQHDTESQHLDKDDWQSAYSLLNHCVRVGQVMSSIGTERGESVEDVHFRRVAGLVHDIGKLHPTCLSYRERRTFSPEERAVLTKMHSAFSAEFVTSMGPRIRSEDYPFLAKLYPVVRHHHDPHRIADETLRQIGYDLMLADMFVSVQEDRYRPGLTIFGALDFIEMVELEKQDSMHSYNLPLIASSKQVILRLYGLGRNPDA